MEYANKILEYLQVSKATPVIRHGDNVNEIKSVLSSLEMDLDYKLLCYTSSLSSSNRLEEEKAIVLELLDSMNSGYYDLKSLLLDSKRINDKSGILKYILFDTGITQEFICEFAECNLNASKAATKLYMHRNTVIYKLDRLVELTGFDLRCFIDMYILYSLTK
jgi:hypothetical protein